MYDFERCHCEFYFDKLVNAAPIDSTLPLPRPSFSLVIATEREEERKLDGCHSAMKKKK